MARKKFRALRCPVFTWTWAGAMVLMVLFCGLLSSSASLHEIIHPDANDGHHQCAITVFAHGHVDLTDGGAPLAVPVFREIGVAVLCESAIINASDYLLLPGRAPPVLAS